MSIIDLIKKPINFTKELVTGTGQFRDETKLGILRNTVFGLPKATKDVFLPTRGYTEEELKQAKPNILDIVKAPIKIGAEISSFAGDVVNFTDKYSLLKPFERLARTQVGDKLADAGGKIKEFSIPKTPEEAKAMRLTDIITAPIGIGKTKNIGTAFKVIAETQDLGVIARELKGLGLADDLIKDLSPKLVDVNNPKVVSDIVQGRKILDIGDSLTGIEKAREVKFQQSLQKLIDDDGVIKTNLQYYNDQMKTGKLEVVKDKDYEKLNRLYKKGEREDVTGAFAPKEVRLQYEKELKDAETNLVDSYRITQPDGSFIDITKDEFDYLNKQLANKNEIIPKNSFAQKLSKNLDPELEIQKANEIRDKIEKARLFGRTLKEDKIITQQANIRKEIKQISDADRLIAENKIRVVRRGDRDVYQYKKSGEWVNARDEDSAVKQVMKSLEPKIPKVVELPPELEQKAIALEFKKESVKNSPFANSDNRFFIDPKEKNVRELGDIRGKLSKKMEDAMLEAGITEPRDFTDGLERYLKDKKDLEIETRQLKEEISNFKAVQKSNKLEESKQVIDKKGQPLSQQKSVDLVDNQKIRPLTDTKTEGEVRSIQKVAEQSLEQANLVDDVEFASLNKIIAQHQTPVNKKINLLDYIRTPSRVLEKIGLGAESRFLEKQYNEYLKELPKNIQKITDWSVQVSKESNERIFKYLDGQAIDLKPDEKKIALEIKSWLKQWAERLGLPEDNRIAEYITHIFDKELLAKEFDEDLAKIIRDKIPSEVYNPFLEKRLGAKGYIQDTWKALDAYVKRATRKVYVDPAISQIAEKSAGFEESQWDYIKKYIDGVNMRPTNIDNLLDNGLKQILGYKLGQRPTNAITRTLRQITYRGMLGGNLSSAMRNISQGLNTYAKLGEKYTAIGYAKLLNSGAKEELIKEGILNNGFIQDRTLNATKKIIEKIDNALFYFFDSAEKINRGSAYFGAKAKALAQGKTEAEAIDFAKKIVRDTQFNFSSVDTPVLLQSDIAKTLTQFQSYTVKQIEFLVEMAQNKEFAGLFRYALGGVAFIYTIGQIFGMEEKDLIPTIRIGVPPSLKLPVETVKAFFDTDDKYGNDRDFEKKVIDIRNAGLGYFPAGIQAKKTYEGAKAVLDGYSKTKDGRKQFEVGGSPVKNLQAIIFGKYASQEAKQYFSGKSIAEVTYEKIKQSDTPREDFEKIKKVSPDLAKQIIAIKKKEDLGVDTDDEKKLRMGVKNYQRAEKIVEELNKLKTREEKGQLWNEYVKKKIITKEVAGQIRQLLNNGSTKPNNDGFINIVRKLSGVK